MPSHRTSWENLYYKAWPKWRRPRPWRSNEESHVIRLCVYQWLTCRDRNRPSGRSWARQIGVSHTWVQKLARRYQSDPTEMLEESNRNSSPTFAELRRAREVTAQMRQQGKLRPARTP